jgi:ABC-2 type transport system ATP-binding protein
VQGRPELVFLDEPTTGMDPVARRQFWDLIRGLRADGTTVLLTTHYLDEAAELADRVGVVADGRLVEVAPPDELGAELRRLATVRWTEDGAPREVRTEAPAAVLRDLLAVTGDVPGLTVTRPGLEDVYLHLVGAVPLTAEGALR